MRAASQHALFQRFPLQGTVSVAGRDMPVPYHVYAGHGSLIACHADARAVATQFDGQSVAPVLTQQGAAVVGLFVCRFDDASHGPHLELHMTALAAPRPGAVIRDSPEALFAAIGMHPDWGVLSLHLWNDVQDVVDYNTHYLGLSAGSAEGSVSTQDRRLAFSFSVDGQGLVSGDLGLSWRHGMRELGSLLRLMGLRGMAAAARQEVATAYVINRRCDVMPENRRALTQTAPDRMVVRRFDPASDKLDFGTGPLAHYGLKPVCIQHLGPFRFVYQHPDDSRVCA